MISGSDEEAAHEAVARAVHLVEMFDQLGWADDDPFLRGIAAGDEAHDWDGHTQPEMIAMTHDEVLGWRTELRSIDELLERLDAAPVGLVSSM